MNCVKYFRRKVHRRLLAIQLSVLADGISSKNRPVFSVVIGLSFHESSCVNVEQFSLIATLCTITVITVYNSPLTNHNFLMQQYFSTKFI